MQTGLNVDLISNARCLIFGCFAWRSPFPSCGYCVPLGFRIPIVISKPRMLTTTRAMPTAWRFMPRIVLARDGPGVDVGEGIPVGVRVL